MANREFRVNCVLTARALWIPMSSYMLTTNEIFLQEFHKNNPGCTPAAFNNGRTIEGINSYDHLSLLLNNKSVATIIDLACGDGALLKNILEKQNSSDLRVIGIDMSIGELNSAKSFQWPSNATFIEAKAQSLPLNDSSADYVFCHMAFMLMDNIEQVVSDIHRCLRPGGVFSAIVGGKFEKSPVDEVFLSLLTKALRDENKTWLTQLGDPRTRSEDGLKSLFDQNHFSNLEINNFKLHFYDRPINLMNFFMLMYDVGLLSKARQKQLHSELLKLLNSMVDDNGCITHSVNLRQFTCKRRT